MTGQAVEPRERLQSVMEQSDTTPGRAEIIQPDADGSYVKVTEGRFENDPVGRPRRRPKVIDARRDPEDMKGKTWDRNSPHDPARGGAEWDKEDTPGSREEGAWKDDREPNAQADHMPLDVPRAEPATPDVLTPDTRPPAAPPAPAATPPISPAVSNRASAKAQGKALAQTAVSSVMDKMRSEAARKGSLSLADIDAMQTDMAAEAAALSATFEQTLEDYAEARERANWDEKRDYPFDRLIVKRFSSLFQEKDLSRFDRISRRMLPGFFLSLGMILGPEAVDDYQEKCRLIVDRVRDEKGDAFDWEDVYAAKDARTLLLDALVEIAIRFEDFERRTNWFVELVNGNLAPPEDAPKDDAGWELSPAGVKNFLNTLLDDLRRVLATDQGRRHITKRHGADAVAAAEQIFDIIDS